MVKNPPANAGDVGSIPGLGRFHMPAAAAAKSLQSCPTLCDPIDGSPPGSPIPGILQARTQEWVAISFPTFIKNVDVLIPWNAYHVSNLELMIY